MMDRPHSIVRRIVRRKLFWAIVSLPLVLAGVAGWLTEPLEAPAPTGVSTPKFEPVAPPKVETLVAWPEEARSGREATAIMIASLKYARSQLESAGAYTATFKKTERINGKLGTEQIIEMKCRNAPFAVYLKYLTPEAGKEVVFSTGHYDDNVIAHAGGLSRHLVPRLKVAPTSAVAMAGNRHPITDAGLLNLTNRLIGFRELDLNDPDAATTLDRYTDKSGRVYLRSVHTHPHQKPERPFQTVEVLYDPETRIPVQISSYDWPAEGEKPGSELKLAERYRYDDLKLGAQLTDADFDPANPSYAFSRGW